MKQLAPFAGSGQWFKGNLHTHSTQSDGAYSPAQACEWYYEKGYDFIALSDHWVSTSGQIIHPDRFITITGVELDGPGYHMLVLGVDHTPDRELADSAADLARWVKHQGGMGFFAHPYWCGQTSQQILDAPDIYGVEVFNSDCDYGRNLGYSNVQWDEALTAGANLTAIAVDDTHWKKPYHGRGYVMVRSASLEEGQILEALKAGQFYCSTGPRIMDAAIHQREEGRFLSVKCSPCRYITFYGVDNQGARVRAESGLIDRAEILIKEKQRYLRIECQDEKGETAWTNAYRVDELLQMSL